MGRDAVGSMALLLPRVLDSIGLVLDSLFYLTECRTDICGESQNDVSNLHPECTSDTMYTLRCHTPCSIARSMSSVTCQPVLKPEYAFSPFAIWTLSKLTSCEKSTIRAKVLLYDGGNRDSANTCVVFENRGVREAR